MKKNKKKMKPPLSTLKIEEAPRTAAKRGKKAVWPIALGTLAVVAVALFLIMRSGSIFKKGRTTGELKGLIGSLDIRNMNILFVTLDTTRADHLGCYGFARAETPNIDRLAREGVLFTNATAQSPLTLPSHSSIFTGAYPLLHGVRDNGGFYLEDDQITMAEVLKQAGWTTSAFIGAYVLDSRWGLGQGFDTYYDNFDTSQYEKIAIDTVQREGGEVVRAFSGWLENNHKNKFFSWLHFYDPHYPYTPPEPFKTKYGANQPFGPYDGEIAYVDALIGEVVDMLKEKGVLDKTLIVIVGDHGESLGEHEEFSHGYFLYDATTKVPLVLRIPSSPIQGKTVTDQVETVDIMPSLFGLLDLPVPKPVQGHSFLPLIAGGETGSGHPAYSETYYPRYHYGWSEIKSLRNGRYKFIQSPKPELYDLKQDPGELANMHSRESGIARSLADELQNLQKKHETPGIEAKEPRKLDEKEREKLRALGYIGGLSTGSKKAGEGGLADPKDKVSLFNKINHSEMLLMHNEYDDALRILKEVVAEDPGIMTARQVRADIYLKLNRPQDAAAECAEILKADENYSEAVFIMARAYKKLKQYDKAEAGFKHVISLDPKDSRPILQLGEVYCEMKEFDKAEAVLRKAMDLDSENEAKARCILGSAYLSNKMLPESEKELLLAIEKNPRIPTAHFNLGLLYEAKGDTARAIEEYRKETEIDPEAFHAHFNLAVLLHGTGRARDAVESYKAAIRANDKLIRAYFFLARAYLDLNENLDEAIALAKKGLAIGPESEIAPLGHYVLAGIYNRLGRTAEALAENEKGRALEKKLQSR